MTFAQLGIGEAVFVDANTFVYHFAPDPKYQAACSQLLHRIESQDYLGFTSTAILSEVAHRLFMLEAGQKLPWSPGKLLQRLKQNPAAWQSMSTFRTAIDSILQSKIKILTIDPPLIRTATILTQRYSLLANDALLIAVVQANGLANLASNDADFDRVPGITRYGPL